MRNTDISLRIAAHLPVAIAVDDRHGAHVFRYQLVPDNIARLSVGGGLISVVFVISV